MICSIEIAERMQQAGVLLTEIHEIDLCLWMFGMPASVYCRGGNRGPHPLDVEDTALLTLDYGDFAASLDLSFMRKPVGRGFRIDGTQASLIWRDGPGPLTMISADGDEETFALPDAFHPEDCFASLIRAFLGGHGPLDTEGSLQAGLQSLQIVQAAKASMASGRAEALV